MESDFAKQLFFNYAKDCPIIDYHNHLPPEEVAQNTRFKNLTAIWLKGDHYKWRAMRYLGVEEQYITGNTDDITKFKNGLRYCLIH